MTPPSAATKAPHELLAVGVGVKPAYGDPCPAAPNMSGVDASTANGFSNVINGAVNATNIISVSGVHFDELYYIYIKKLEFVRIQTPAYSKQRNRYK